MYRPLVLAAGLLLAAPLTRAQDAIPADTVVAVKKATVFIRVQAGASKVSGTGFVISADKDGVLIATNYHVVNPVEREKRVTLTPGEVVKSLKEATISVVFDGGTATELSAKAQAVAGDAEADLAILRVTGLKAPPKPIDYTTAPRLTETMPVYLFGFPFGEALATGKGSPAITVGKGSVSSLRLDEKGELSLVQIDGALNPGNSGGPVVDSKGQLVGVAVSTAKNGQGIGFAVPAAELGKVMKGRLGGFHLTATRVADNKLKVRAEVGVIDPAAALRGVTLHYLVVDPKGKKPDGKEPVAKHPAAKKLLLKIEGGIASGEVTLDAADGELLVQAVPEGGPGTAGLSSVRSFGLTLPKGAAGAVALGPVGAAPAGSGAGEVPAPAGWKEHTAANKTYKVWLPEKGRTSQKERTMGNPPGLRLTFTSIVAEMPGGQTYLVEQILLTPPRLVDRDEIMKILRDVAIGDAPGAKVTRESDTKMGQFSGREFLVERGTSATRARGFVIGTSIYLLRAIGTRDQVEAAESTMFLDSCRMQVVARPPTGGPGAAIAGGRNDPEFTDPVPAGGALVGLELGLGKQGANTVVKAVRAVFRVGGKESTGVWHGPTGPEVIKDTVKVIAKPGYAVGGISVRTGPGIYGLSVTFMKMAGGKLDPKDSYESEWVGATIGAGPVKLGGTGDAALGLIGKSNANTASGIGLLYTDAVRKGPSAVVNRGPRIQGGGDLQFKDIGPDGGLLVGLEVGLGKFFDNDIVVAVRPVYRVGDKESLGVQYGTDTSRVVKVVAKPGYAVGALTLRTGLGVDGVSLTFMKATEGKLDTADSYESEWLGGNGGGGRVRIGGDGTAVTGLLGKTNTKDVTALGLAYVGEKPWPAGKLTQVQGGGEIEHRDGAPAGGLLVGFEVGLGKFFDNDIVKAVRPIYRVGDKESLGEQYGTDTSRVVKIKAKPGYAVGGIMVKTGLGVDGVSVIFMKVTDGKLDPRENYESEWLGVKDRTGLVRISGEGTPVVGFVAKANPKDVTGLGLLLKDADKK